MTLPKKRDQREYDKFVEVGGAVAVRTNAIINTGDIEIGAVEIKNGTDDTRATVTASNALKVDGSAVVQPINDNSGSLTVDGTVTTTHGKTLKSVSGTCNTNGNNTLVSAVASNKIKVFAFSLTVNSTTAVTAIFQSGAGGTELWRVTLQSPTNIATGANLAVSPPAHLFETAAVNTLLNLSLSAAVTVHYSVAYFEEA
jgi:hypothetical protein